MIPYPLESTKSGTPSSWLWGALITTFMLSKGGF